MALGTITEYPTGLTAISPSILYISTTDTYATVTTTGYLNPAKVLGSTFSNDQMALVLTSDDGPVFLQVSVTQNGTVYNYSLVEPVGPGDISLPTVAGALAVFTTTTGHLADNQANATNAVSTSSATPGTVRALVGSMAGSATTMTTGNLVGVRGAVTLVGASGGFLYGVQGKVISTGTLSGSSWTAGMFGQLDISAATVNAGQTAPVWADYGTSSGTITSATGMRMFAGTNTTAATLNSMIYLYGKASNLFELSLNGSTYVSTGGSGVLSGTIQKIAITVGGVTYYIPIATVIS